jgi:hypothetical protein
MYWIFELIISLHNLKDQLLLSQDKGLDKVSSINKKDVHANPVTTPKYNLFALNIGLPTKSSNTLFVYSNTIKFIVD